MVLRLYSLFVCVGGALVASNGVGGGEGRVGWGEGLALSTYSLPLCPSRPPYHVRISRGGWTVGWIGVVWCLGSWVGGWVGLGWSGLGWVGWVGLGWVGMSG